MRSWQAFWITADVISFTRRGENIYKYINVIKGTCHVLMRENKKTSHDRQRDRILEKQISLLDYAKIQHFSNI